MGTNSTDTTPDAATFRAFLLNASHAEAGGMTMENCARGASPTFDATVWLHSLVAIGGGYALASGGRLWLVVRDCPADHLAPLMAQIVGQPERQEALKTAIEQHRCGAVA